MNNKNRNILLGVLIVGVISMTVAFAALSTRLNINGTTNVAATKWNIRFENWSLDTLATVNGHQNTAVYPSIDTLKNSMSDETNVTKVDDLDVTLKQPGDYAKYNFEIANRGTIAAKLSNFTHGLTPSSEVISEEVKCYTSRDRTGNEITTNAVLGVEESVYCYIKVQYNDQTNAQTPGQSQVYHQDAIDTSLSASWTWVQDDGSNNSQEEQGGTVSFSNIDGAYYTYEGKTFIGTGVNNVIITPEIISKAKYASAEGTDNGAGANPRYTFADSPAADAASVYCTNCRLMTREEAISWDSVAGEEDESSKRIANYNGSASAWWLADVFSTDRAYVVNNRGGVGVGNVTYNFGVRPAVSIDAGSTMSGSGTIDSPYVIQ